MKLALPFLSLISTIISMLAIALLHIVSPEFQPSWRMISEYALGNYHSLITLFFFCWGISSWLLAISLFSFSKNIRSKIGVAFLIISGIGEFMGGLFDIKHPLHGTAFALGVPSTVIAALLIGLYLKNNFNMNKRRIQISSHLTWISVVLLAISMIVFISGLQKAGLFHPETGEVLKVLPAGIIAVSGYANRFLVACDLWWLIVIATEIISYTKKMSLIY